MLDQQTDHKPDHQLEHLHERIRVLEMENNQLANQAEDTLLLGIIHEAISPLNDCRQILEQGLERISLLKDIPYCCCTDLEGGDCRVLVASLSFSHESLEGQCLELSGIGSSLQTPLYLDGDACAEIALQAPDGFIANELLLIPCRNRFLSKGLFVFACHAESEGNLDASLIMLCRIVEALMLAMDNVMIVDELKRMNSTLDQRVEQRTRQYLESEAQYRSLIDQAMDAIFVFSKVGRFIDVNPAACRNLGYTQDELLSLSVSDIVVDRKSSFVKTIVNQLESAGPFINEATHTRKDGSTYPVETHLGMILLQGEICVLAISHDISQRKAHEATLHQAHALLQGLFDAIPDLIFHKNSDGVYLGCNQAFARFVGKEAQQHVIGLSDYDLFDADQADLFRNQDASMIRQRSSQRNEAWVNYPDDQDILFDTLRTPYYHPDDGSLLGLIGISRDITEYRKTEEQLLQAQKMEGIGTLVGGIAHDFNNMLAGMMGNIFLIQQDDSLSPACLKKTERMNELCERAANMIAQLLTFARKGHIQMLPVEFVGCLKNALKLFQLSIPANINVELDIACDDPLIVMGDSVQIQQLVLNLLVNARDAVKDVDKPSIRIGVKRIAMHAKLNELYPSLAEGPWIELLFSDNGCGISETIRDQLFDPFFTTKEVGEGSGLGLSTVYGVVQSHQAAIKLESEELKGTTFHVYFPLYQSDESENIESDIELAHGNGETILLADDEEIVLSTTSTLLQHLGYQVITAHSGLEAVRKATDRHIDLAVLDVVMPEMDGLEAAKQLRKMQPELPIIFATAYDQALVLKKSQQLDNSSIMGKPFRLMTLSKKMRKALI